MRFLVGVVAVLASSCAGERVGLDDWGPVEIAAFCNEALGDAAGRVQITPALVTAIGLSRHDLFDNIKLKEQLDPLGITYTEWEKLEAAFIKLDAEVTRNPKDYLEWRTVNAEMSDMWITPLAIFTPRSLLVWMRYTTGDPETNALERVDESIEAMSELEFWIATTFIPHHTLATHVTSKFVIEDETWLSDVIDTWIQRIVLFSVLGDLFLIVAILFQHSFASEVLARKIKLPAPLSTMMKKREIPSLVPFLRSNLGPRAQQFMSAVPWLLFGICWLHHLIELSSKTSYACALVLVVALFWSRTRRLFLHFVAPPVQKKGASSNNGISANGFSRSVSNFVWWHVDESITSVPIIWVGGMFLWAMLDYLAFIGTLCSCIAFTLFVMALLDHQSGGVKNETGSQTAALWRVAVVTLVAVCIFYMIYKFVNMDPRELLLKTNWYAMVLFVLPPVAARRCYGDARLLWNTLKP